MFVVDIVNGTKVYSKVCSSCRQDTDYYQLEDEYYNFTYLSDCCNAECYGGMMIVVNIETNEIHNITPLEVCQRVNSEINAFTDNEYLYESYEQYLENREE